MAQTTDMPARVERIRNDGNWITGGPAAMDYLPWRIDGRTAVGVPRLFPYRDIKGGQPSRILDGKHPAPASPYPGAQRLHHAHGKHTHRMHRYHRTATAAGPVLSVIATIRRLALPLHAFGALLENRPKVPSGRPPRFRSVPVPSPRSLQAYSGRESLPLR